MAKPVQIALRSWIFLTSVASFGIGWALLAQSDQVDTTVPSTEVIPTLAESTLAPLATSIPATAVPSSTPVSTLIVVSSPTAAELPTQVSTATPFPTLVPLPTVDLSQSQSVPSQPSGRMPRGRSGGS